MTVSLTSIASPFAQFGFDESILRGIGAAGFETPRPIQFDTIPAGREGRDVLGLAQTGTGKTAAFALPMLDRLYGGGRAKGPRALVLAPTRELATQIAEEIRVLSTFTKLKSLTIYGGVSMRNQIDALRGRPDIIIGCPGRVLDLIGQGHLRLGSVETLVLDEADHMFDMGFLPDIKKIIATLPEHRQNLLFSATMPKEIRGLANDLLNNPHVVELAHAAPASTIDHALYLVPDQRKKVLLETILKSKECETAIVFTRTKHRARRLADQLKKAGHNAVGLQGSMTQGQRDRAMNGFRSRRFDILVATDIAARGIDVSNVSHVINFDVPRTAEDYTHRIGRTGRAEREGVALTFVTAEDGAWLRSTEKMIGSAIPRLQIEGFDPGFEMKSEAKTAKTAARKKSGPPRRSGTKRRSKWSPRGRGGKSVRKS